MYISSVDNKEIKVSIPLTNGKEKTRIKRRSVLNEYGVQVSTRSESFSQSCYVEWQVGYDVITSNTDKLSRTTMPNIRFIGANGKEKALYELSEYVKYFYDWSIITTEELLAIKNYLISLKDDDFLDNSITHPQLAIKRTNFVETEFNGLKFLRTQVEYPMLVHKFENFEIVTEITIKERQYAIGVQPMLYLCFPVTELENSEELLGRTARTNETAEFKINSGNICVFVEMLKIFGMLSRSHNTDVITILDTIML